MSCTINSRMSTPAAAAAQSTNLGSVAASVEKHASFAGHNGQTMRVEREARRNPPENIGVVLIPHRDENAWTTSCSVARSRQSLKSLPFCDSCATK